MIIYLFLIIFSFTHQLISKFHPDLQQKQEYLAFSHKMNKKS